MDDQVLLASFDRRVRSARVTPVRAKDELPRVVKVAEIDGIGRLDEDERSGMEQFLLRAGIVGRIRRLLGKRGVTGLFDDCAKLAFVTGVRSIQKPSTVTRCTGRSSG
jgi:hypothetical protein